MVSFKRQNSAVKNLYVTGGKTNNQDIDIRSELSSILREDEKSSIIIYRRVRRNEEGTPILHDAVKQNRSHEAVLGVNDNNRYLFDDYLMRCYISTGSTYHESGEITPYGDSKTDNLKIFLEYDCLYHYTKNKFDLPDELDQIITLQSDIEGELRSPLRARNVYDIGTVDPYRLDNDGRIEFYSVNLMSRPDKSVRL